MKSSNSAIFFSLLACSSILSQEPPATQAEADPFVRKPTPEESALLQAPKIASICLESFSLELSDAAALYHSMPTDGKLYEEITARVAKDRAKLESFTVARARSGERSTVECISEYIYPTEFEHGNGPTPAQPEEHATPPGPAAPAGYFAPVLPVAFETRNVGLTLEIEPTIGRDDRIVDLRIVPERVTLVDRTKWGQGVSETEIPNFESQRLVTAVTLIPGQPQLLGTPSRPPVSKVDADSASRVWFTFVTARLIAVLKE